MPTIVNKTFGEIAIGDTASVQRIIQAEDLRAWGAAFGDADLLAGAGESQAIAGIITGLLTALAGSELPGPGSVVRTTRVEIMGALPIGAALTAGLIVQEKHAGQGLLTLAGECHDPAGVTVATATLEVVAPTVRIERQLPEHRLEGLLGRCRGLKPMLTGVVHPCSADALTGAADAAAAGLIVPVLYGPEAELRRIAEQTRIDLTGFRIVATDGAEDSAQKAAAAAGAGEVAALVPGRAAIPGGWVGHDGVGSHDQEYPWKRCPTPTGAAAAG